MRTSGIAFVIVFTSVLFPFLPVQAQNVNNDYFTTPQSDELLTSVEKYHLSAENFWKVFREGDNQAAILNLKYVLRYFPNHPEALDLLGLIAKLTKTPSLPISHYHKTLRLFPQHAFTHAQYGNYLAENSVNNVQIKEGIANLEKAIEMNPKLAVAYAWLANAYYKTGNSELALQSAKKAKELDYQDEKLESILNNDTK
jgi:Tfp pilus assembly protein PilF